MFITIYFAFIFPNISIVRTMWERGFFHQVMMAFVLLTVAGAVSGIDGQNTGKMFLEGKSPDSTVIEFTYKDSITFASEQKILDKQNLLLILYRNGNYYVEPYDDPAPRDSSVFIITEDQLGLVKTKRVY